MRLRTALAATAAAVSAAAVVAGPALALAQSPRDVAVTGRPPGDVTVAGREPSCGDTAARDFPLRTRIVSGPAAYHPGAAPSTWYVDLTNTTRHPCRNIHPVIVVADTSGTLTPAQVRLGFSTAPGGRPRPVRVEHTDHDEIVAVLDDDTDRAFAGFAVPPGGTVRVPVHLAFAADARLDELTAHAAVVQRRGDDGDWVGASPSYRFALVAPERPPGILPEELASTGRRAAAHVVPLSAAAATCVALGTTAVYLTRRHHRR
ncbi:hypothetical protein [Streptomyces kanasensis]|uniref:hypothetical protein n=1 Tax=Streptomyces kanasensis TaxID=936756 RepID=UPI0038014B18